MSKSKRKSEPRGRRTFTEEFKKDAVNLALAPTDKNSLTLIFAEVYSICRLVVDE